MPDMGIITAQTPSCNDYKYYSLLPVDAPHTFQLSLQAATLTWN